MSAPDPHHNGRGPSGERDALMDLLTTRATEGISLQESQELDRMLGHAPDVDPDGLELAAATVAVAYFDEHDNTGAQPEAMPDALRRRLRSLAMEMVIPGTRRLPDDGVAKVVARPQDVSTLRLTESERPPRPVAKPRGLSLGWLAAAAAVVLAGAGWWRATNVGGPAAQKIALVAEYTTFVQQADDLVRWPWQGKEAGFEGVKGEVVWSDALQRGYMTFTGLTANDPTQKEYQLWIVDPLRDKHPVDGGVFDIAASCGPDRMTPKGEIIVPIESKLKVTKPAAFALTVEKPGGVVVSDGPLVLVAAR